MEKEPKVLLKFMKSADKSRNKIIIPQFVIDNFGRDYYLEVYEDGTMKLIPIKYKEKNKEMEE